MAKHYIARRRRVPAENLVSKHQETPPFGGCAGSNPASASAIVLGASTPSAWVTVPRLDSHCALLTEKTKKGIRNSHHVTPQRGPNVFRFWVAQQAPLLRKACFDPFSKKKLKQANNGRATILLWPGTPRLLSKRRAVTPAGSVSYLKIKKVNNL